ncbi:hypothetical protein [Faecalicoccus pleomorphus]|uniref:hypothetical protein n=1 Tax=Faecalicoccus pleomorphus TaxID=1323 RepID=UPI00174B3D3C|nr:hypothetical protein [Faecalicoccus pleomorphus]
MVVKKNEEHTKMVLRNRRLIQRYNMALRDDSLEDLERVKRLLQLEIIQQAGSKNVRFLQVVLDNVK